MAREVRVKSHDGVEVPVSIISRADIKLDGSNPTILYAYGAYGLTESPGWSPRLLAWLEKGGVYAFAHVRGGGVFGDAWHRAGQKTTKPNTWKDGIAAAEWLIAQGYTSSGPAGGHGRQRWRHLRGPCVDGPAGPLRGSGRRGGQHRPGALRDARQWRANIPEYGTVKKEDEFRALLEMSPYAQIARWREISRRCCSSMAPTTSASTCG